MSGILDIHQRTRRLLGDEALDALRAKKVLVAGLGGVGGSCALALARCNIGALVLIDSDTVAASNLNRQTVAFVSTLGLPKAQVAALMISDIDPGIELAPLIARVSEKNAPELIQGCDMVVDAIDDLPAKVALAAAAREAGVPIVASMGAGNRLDPTRFRVGDLYKTQVDPLARAMRAACRKAGIDKLAVVWSDEAPIKPPSDEQGGHSPASIAFAPNAAGLVLAHYVVMTLLKEGAP